MSEYSRLIRGNNLPFRTRLWRRIFDNTFVDKILRVRANDLYDKAGFGDFITPGASLLDVGCGSGHMTECIISRSLHLPGIHCTSLDPVGLPLPRVMRRLKKSASGRFEFHAVGGQDISLPDESVDLSWLCFVLHHIPYEIQLDVISQIRRVMKPGGTFILYEDTPDNQDEWNRIERWDRIQNFESRDSKHYYRSCSQWRELFASHGFTLTREFRFDKMIPQMSMEGVPHALFIFKK